VALFVVLLYLPSVGNGFVYDDETLILKEPRPAALKDFTDIFDQRHFPNVPYYRPVSRLTFRAQHFLHGKNPAPFHLFNALLAGLTAAAAYGLLRRPAFRIAPVPAVLAALLFAVHPAASSCVYPICSGRETLLPALLMLLALRAWLIPGSARARAAAAGLWILALFAKEQSVVLPALFLLSDRLDLSGDGRLRRPLRLAGWYAAMALAFAGYLAVRLRLFGGSEFAPALGDQPAGPLLSLLYALQTLWCPYIALAYEPPVDVWFSLWRSCLALLVTALIAAAGWRLRRRYGRPLLFWAAWFVLIQLPTANLLRQEALFDERYVFLANLSLLAAAASVLSPFWNLPAIRRTFLATALLLAALLAAASLGRRETFRDDEAFSRQWVRTNPLSAIARNNLGRANLDRGRLAEAESDLRTARDLDPGLAEIHFNLATVLFRRSRIPEAVAGFEEALRLKPAFGAHYNLALALEAADRLPEAEARYREALAREPGHAEAAYNLGRLLGRTGRLEEAETLFRRVAQAHPADPDSAYNLGVTLERLERLDEAAAAYLEAIGRDPARPAPRFNLANIRFRQTRYAEAAAGYEAVLTLDPSDEQARANLAAARKLSVSP
jgi:tetratricopeptide (TPR) repeat protein